MTCDITVKPGDDLAAALSGARGGATVCLTAGTYDGPVKLARDVTLRAADGAAEVVIDGMGAGPIIKLAPGRSVHLEGLTLRGGRAEIGGGLQVLGGADVTLTRCVFEQLSATAKGGAIFVEEGKLTANRTIFRGNKAATGGAIAVEGEAEATFEACLFQGNAASRGAALSFHDGSKARVSASSFISNTGDGADINVRGSMSRAPAVVVTASLFTGGVTARPVNAAVVTRSAFEATARHAVDGPGNVKGPLALDASGRPGGTSSALGVAGDGFWDTLDGALRPKASATAGAYEPTP